VRLQQVDQVTPKTLAGLEAQAPAARVIFRGNSQ
jgi:hypothetical protein